ncbi:MAG TPA: VOC family protein [Candidatus Eremiobacteraceae bacterium]|nr:VOC family protein [Candidatus Eremiobacteraceae bacterium]
MPVHPIHHLAIGTDAFNVAKKFYGALLPALGFDQVFERDDSFGYQREGFEIIVIKAKSVKEDLYDGERRVGFDHLALTADTRAKVDECAKILDELGADIDDEPSIVSEMGEDYYAMWVRDPSGLRIEVVCQGGS